MLQFSRSLSHTQKIVLYLYIYSSFHTFIQPFFELQHCNTATQYTSWIFVYVWYLAYCDVCWRLQNRWTISLQGWFLLPNSINLDKNQVKLWYFWGYYGINYWPNLLLNSRKINVFQGKAQEFSTRGRHFFYIFAKLHKQNYLFTLARQAKVCRRIHVLNFFPWA